jgi:cob(I)alamin adenosyltransferase
MKIYTKTGDKGQTSLLGGTRVPKYHLRINAYGTVDELNANLGLLRDGIAQAHHQTIVEIQNRLFTVGSSLAAETERAMQFKPDILDADILFLENEMDRMNEILPAMRNFILPGGHQSVSICHVCRCVCRRAERLVIELAGQAPVEENVVKYLNRLSDYLFVLARMLAHELGVEEVPWHGRKAQ